MGISVVLLAYKEAENLSFLLPKIKDIMDGLPEEYEILVIDTKEPLDNTSDVCKEYGARYINQEFPGFGGNSGFASVTAYIPNGSAHVGAAAYCARIECGSTCFKFCIQKKVKKSSAVQLLCGITLIFRLICYDNVLSAAVWQGEYQTEILRFFNK